MINSVKELSKNGLKGMLLKTSSYLNFSCTSDIESVMEEVKLSKYSFGISCKLKTSIKFWQQYKTFGGKETINSGKCKIIYKVETNLHRFFVDTPMNIERKIFVDIVPEIKLLVVFANFPSGSICCSNNLTS